MVRTRKKWPWLILIAAGMSCLWAAISERESLAEAGGETAGTAFIQSPQAQTPPSFALRDVQPLTFIYWTKEDCEWTGTCYQNNPFNNYALLTMPADPLDPYRECTKIDTMTGACLQKFQMSGDDVILLYGRTMNNGARYFNFLLNQVDRWDGESGRERTESSIGLGINQLTLKHYGEDPFDAPFFMIISASTTSANFVKYILIASGISEDWINVYLFHRDFANGYLGENADYLSLMYRISCADEESIATYVFSDPVRALLFRGSPTAIGDVTEMEEWVPRTDLVEWDQQDDLLTLVTETITHYWPTHGMPDLIYPEGLNHLDPLECRGEVAHYEKCHYDNPDSLYINYKWSEYLPVRLFLDEDDFIILAGINHAHYQLENYFSYFMYRDSDGYGFTGFQDVDTIGSAPQYWPAAEDRFFAYKIAFNCGADPWCHEIPTGEWGIAPGDRFIMSGRIYLDPVSKTGPDPDNFVPSVILLYQN